MEKRNLEQRCAIKVCVKLNENATETYEKLEGAYGEHALSRTQVFRWHKTFLDGRECVEDEPRSGRPCTSKTDENLTKVRDLLRSDRPLTVRMISSVLNVNRQTVHEILTFELGKQKICAKLVPKILTNEQKVNRRNVCLDLLERIENDKKISNMSQQVMKRGFSNTILTPNDKVRSGTRATHRAQREQK